MSAVPLRRPKALSMHGHRTPDACIAAQAHYMFDPQGRMPDPEEIHYAIGGHVWNGWPVDGVYDYLLGHGFTVVNIDAFDKTQFAGLSEAEALRYVRRFYDWDENTASIFRRDRLVVLQRRAGQAHARHSAFASYSHELRRPTITDVRRLLDNGFVVNLTTLSDEPVLISRPGTNKREVEAYGVGRQSEPAVYDIGQLKDMIDFRAGISGYRGPER
jgi:hypothetical protein